MIKLFKKYILYNYYFIMSRFFDRLCSFSDKMMSNYSDKGWEILRKYRSNEIQEIHCILKTD